MPSIRIRALHAAGLAVAAAAFASAPLAAQENYEIQVYGSETIPKNATMFELHSNYTLNGRRFVSAGELPSHHAVHETIEITHGFNDWSELGFYWFMAKPSGKSFQWVGTHLRPRVRAPDSWGWPVGVSISQEIGWAKPEFSADTWTYELRPIIDKSMGAWYISLNPVLEKSLRGPSSSTPFIFSPNANLAYDVTKVVNLAIEYYGSLGPIDGFDPVADQAHQIYAAINLDFGPQWEFNLAYGTSLTGQGDKRLVKMIFGRRVGLK